MNMEEYINKILEGQNVDEAIASILESDAQIQSALNAVKTNPSDEKALYRLFKVVKRAGKRLFFTPRNTRMALSISSVLEIVDVRTRDQIDTSEWRPVRSSGGTPKPYSPKEAPEHRYLFIQDSNPSDRPRRSIPKRIGGLNSYLSYWLSDELAIEWKPTYIVDDEVPLEP